ncbi:MAG: PAS domain S-box protein, partial [Thermodesulfobacteriota bacterium]|nr:PAS domain S-box protein [Thermodesulfobacteriota bacterium]
MKKNHNTTNQIQEFKTVDKKFEGTEKLLTALFFNSPIGIYIVQEGKFTFVNPRYQKSTGYSKDELLNTESLKLVFPEDQESVRENAIAMLKGKRSSPYEYRFIKKDGDIMWIIETVTSIQYQKKRAVLGNFMDITEKKHAEEEERQSTRLLLRVMQETIGAMALAIEKRDPYTAGHQKQVAELATAIAYEMNLSRDQIDGIRLAGTIHDLGKIFVPAEILNKPGDITEMESNLIKIHPKVGYDIVKSIEFPWPIAHIILQHHEHMDGSGYPFGLSSENILMEARILTVADVVVA